MGVSMIKSVAKAMEILNLFSSEEPRLSLSQIAQRLNIPKATAHNILATLMQYDFIEKTSDDRYALGNAIIAMTQAVRVNVELRDRAAPLLRQLADECRETVYLTTLDGGSALYIYAVESPRRLLARTAVGERVPLHCTSVGKAILAFLDEESVTKIIELQGLPAFTERTITDKEILYQELAETRQRGYAIDRGEHEVGTYCVGAPILDSERQVIGACSISGTDPEIVGERMEELGQRIMQVAHEISRRMGYVPNRLSALPISLREG